MDACEADERIMKHKKSPHRNLSRIRNFLDKIEFAFELNNFKRSITLIDTQPEDNPGLTAEVTPDMIYRELTIKLYPHFWELSLDAQREALLHELVHTLIQNTKMFAVDLLHGSSHSEQDIKYENEIATSRITHLLDCLLRNRLRYAKKAYREYSSKKTTAPRR